MTTDYRLTLSSGKADYLLAMQGQIAIGMLTRIYKRRPIEGTSSQRIS